jgi:hypothetical protein
MEREEEGGRIPAIRMDPRDVKMYRFWEKSIAKDGLVCSLDKKNPGSKKRSGIALFIHRDMKTGFDAVLAIVSNNHSGRSSDSRFILLAASSRRFRQ